MEVNIDMPGPLATTRISSQLDGTLVVLEDFCGGHDAVPNLMQQSMDPDNLLCTLAECDVLSTSG